MTCGRFAAELVQWVPATFLCSYPISILPSLVALSSPLFSPFGGCCPRSGRHGLRPAPAVLQGKAAGAATRHGRRRALLQRRWRCCNRRGVKLQADAASRRRGDAATSAARQAGQRCYKPWPPATGAATGEPENKRRCCKATPAPAFKAVRRPVRRGASTCVRRCFNTSLSLLQGGGMVLRPVCGELRPVYGGAATGARRCFDARHHCCKGGVASSRWGGAATGTQRCFVRCTVIIRNDAATMCCDRRVVESNGREFQSDGQLARTNFLGSQRIQPELIKRSRTHPFRSMIFFLSDAP